MNRKRWALVSAAAVVAVIVIFVVGVVAGRVTDSSADKNLAARVAVLLEQDGQTVQGAMTQAQRDLREEAAKARLDELVASGGIAQNEADEYMAWLESAPATTHGYYGYGHYGHKGHGRRGHRGRHGWGLFR